MKEMPTAFRLLTDRPGAGPAPGPRTRPRPKPRPGAGTVGSPAAAATKM